MELSQDERREMHSGDYVQLVESVPISRMTRLIPLMPLTPDTRLVDFAAGLVFSAHGSINRVTAKVFLLSPAGIEVSDEDKQRIAAGGFYDQH